MSRILAATVVVLLLGACCLATNSLLDPAPPDAPGSGPLSGAIFGTSDFRRQAASDVTYQMSRATVAFVAREDFESTRTNADELRSTCGADDQKCGPNITGAMADLLDLPNIAQASGVLVRTNVVATSAHVKDNVLGDDIERFGVAFDLDGLASPTFVPILRAERVNPDVVLVLLDTEEVGLPSGIEPLPLPGNVEWSEPLPTLAFGHPLGSARLTTGGNDHTRINRCTFSLGRRVKAIHRATLDSLQRSSGSPIFIRLPNEPWTLFGVLLDSPGNSLSCHHGTCDIVRVPHVTLDPCRQRDGSDRGAIITPLVGLDAAIDAFDRTEEQIDSTG